MLDCILGQQEYGRISSKTTVKLNHRPGLSSTLSFSYLSNLTLKPN
jgi:hypothetical protein